MCRYRNNSVRERQIFCTVKCVLLSALIYSDSCYTAVACKHCEPSRLLIRKKKKRLPWTEEKKICQLKWIIYSHSNIVSSVANLAVYFSTHSAHSSSICWYSFFFLTCFSFIETPAHLPCFCPVNFLFICFVCWEEKRRWGSPKGKKFQRSFDLIKSPGPIKTYQNKLWLPTKRQWFKPPWTTWYCGFRQQISKIYKCSKIWMEKGNLKAEDKDLGSHVGSQSFQHRHM